MVLAAIGTVIELKLAAADDSQMKPIIPSLYDSQLVTMHGNGMLFRGYNRGLDGAGYVQEWSVQISATQSLALSGINQ